MNELQTTQEQLPQVKTWNGQRVVTLKDIDEVHQRKIGTASRNFKRNKKHFIKDVDYYLITRENFNGRNSSNKENLPFEWIPPKGITLFTESGYLMIVKSFTDDLAWDVQRRLVNCYFNMKEQAIAQALPEKNPPRDYMPKVPKVATKKGAKMQALPPAANWYERNASRIRRICKMYKVSKRTLYHYILLDLGKKFNLDSANRIYKWETDRAPQYAMDVVNYFPELGEAADKYLDSLEKLR